MPTYEFKCANGHVFDVFQKMTDPPPTECPECGATVERVFHPVPIHFKGSGFHNTDYKAKPKTKTSDGDSGSDSGDSSSSDSGSDDSSSKGKSDDGEAKKPAKTESD